MAVLVEKRSLRHNSHGEPTTGSSRRRGGTGGADCNMRSGRLSMRVAVARPGRGGDTSVGSHASARRALTALGSPVREAVAQLDLCNAHRCLGARVGVARGAGEPHSLAERAGGGCDRVVYGPQWSGFGHHRSRCCYCCRCSCGLSAANRWRCNTAVVERPYHARRHPDDLGEKAPMEVMQLTKPRRKRAALCATARSCQRKKLSEQKSNARQRNSEMPRMQLQLDPKQ